MYRLTDTSVIIRIADCANISADPDNADYAAYLAWVAAGNTPQPAPVPSLDDVKTEAIERVDAAAGRARLRYITDVPGQVATYQIKEQQARAFVADPTIAPVPSMVQAEAYATGMTAVDAAQFIVATADQWLALVPVIERERRRGKVNVDAAVTAEAVQTSAQAAIDALDAI